MEALTLPAIDWLAILPLLLASGLGLLLLALGLFVDDDETLGWITLIGLVVTAWQAPGLLLTVILPSWIVLMLVRYVFVPLRARDKVLGLFLYMLFYEACLYWLNVWALFTVRNRSWVTRQVVAQA